MTRPTHIHHGRPRIRWPRRLAAVAFALALATVAFAATVASLAGLTVPPPAAPTATTTVYLPVPTSPTPASVGGGR